MCTFLLSAQAHLHLGRMATASVLVFSFPIYKDYPSRFQGLLLGRESTYPIRNRKVTLWFQTILALGLWYKFLQLIDTYQVLGTFLGPMELAVMPRSLPLGSWHFSRGARHATNCRQGRTCQTLTGWNSSITAHLSNSDLWVLSRLVCTDRPAADGVQWLLHWILTSPGSFSQLR